MKKSIGSKKKGAAVFISGKGSNLKNLINFSKSKKSPILIKLIVSNSVNAKGLVYAKKYKIQKKIYNFKIKKNTEEKILILMKKKKIDLICLAGFMTILSKNFIRKFKKKIINIHPSLLPKYKGLDTHQRVLLNKEEYTGCSVHYVSSKLDSGKIILQKKIKILKKDNATSLGKRVLKEEHELYPKAILKIYS